MSAQPSPFIILGSGRSGTTMFRDEIDSHPRICCFMEPFHRLADDPRANPLFQGEPLFDEFAADPGQTPAPRTDLYGPFLDHLAERAALTVWGFKIIATQVGERPGLLEELRRREFKVLLVNRRNEVHTALSLLIAANRGVFNTRAEVPAGQVRIDPRDLLRTILAARKAKQALAEVMARLGFAAHECVYEERLAGGPQYLRAAVAFLGEDPDLPLRASTLKRMAPAHRYAEIIANHGEVGQALQAAGLDHLL